MAGPSAARTISHPESAVREIAAREVRAARITGGSPCNMPSPVRFRSVLRVFMTPTVCSVFSRTIFSGALCNVGRCSAEVSAESCLCGAAAGIILGTSFWTMLHRYACSCDGFVCAPSTTANACTTLSQYSVSSVSWVTIRTVTPRSASASRA